MRKKFQRPESSPRAFAKKFAKAATEIFAKPKKVLLAKKGRGAAITKRLPAGT